MKLGEKIKSLRKSKGISQEELAAMLKINRNYLSRVETGKSEPTAGILKQIAIIFNIDLNSLLDINNDNQDVSEKVKYIVNNCKYLHEKDLDFIVRIITVMKEEYVKVNAKTKKNDNNEINHSFYIKFNMKNTNEKLLKEINIDIIFFFLAAIKAGVSFYLINEKKKSALNIESINNTTANKIYYYNRRLNLIIAIYFFLNAYYSYQNATTEEEKKQEGLLTLATFFILIGATLYLPLGNSNLIIEN